MPDEQLDKISDESIVMLYKNGDAFLVAQPAIAKIMKDAVAENPHVLAFHADKISFSDSCDDVLDGSYGDDVDAASIPRTRFLL